MSQSRGRKSIFITGAGSGIGRATARLFASRGWYVGLFDIDGAGIAETARTMPSDSFCTGLFDVRDRDGWSRAVGQFDDATGGQMHALFNNAGIGRHGWFEDIAQDDSDAILDINIKGVLNGVYACLPLLEKTQGARIINTSSVAGIVAPPQLAVYAASKHAVRGLSEALDLELTPKGIRVVALCPWFVDTPILNAVTDKGTNATTKADMKGLTVYPVDMAAEGAWAAFHGDESLVTVGKAAHRTRFLARWFPGFVRQRMAKGMAERG